MNIKKFELLAKSTLDDANSYTKFIVTVALPVDRSIVFFSSQSVGILAKY